MRFLYKKDGIIYTECEKCRMKMNFKEYELSSVKEGVECFCGNVSNAIVGMTTQNSQSTAPIPTPNTSQSVLVNSVRITGPKCPTCGSYNVRKISLGSKAVGGAMFGLFSSDIRNTYRCDQCGYKW